MIKRHIQVKFQKDGIHFFPEANTEKELDDVSFLGSPHHHYFYFVVTIQVWHDNRDIEFIQFRRWLESLYNSGSLQLNNYSCEMIAGELLLTIKEKYSGRDVKIEVYEDNINGSILEYTHKEVL